MNLTRASRLQVRALYAALQHLDNPLGVGEMGVHLKGLLKSSKGGRLVLLEYLDLTQAAQSAEMPRFEHQGCLNIGDRVVEVSKEVVHGGAPVPGLSEIRGRLDELTEIRERIGEAAFPHCIGAALHELGQLGTIVFKPDCPDRSLRHAGLLRLFGRLNNREKTIEARIVLVSRGEVREQHCGDQGQNMDFHVFSMEGLRGLAKSRLIRSLHNILKFGEYLR